MEQQAFCRLAQRVADAVITRAMSPRMRGDVAGLLNVLAAHHGEPLLHDHPVRDVRVAPLHCELDQAPGGKHPIDPNAPPAWLSLSR